MSRKEFFIEYYKRTDRKFADHTINSKSDRETASRKRQGLTSKAERILFIITQYAVLFLCWIPVCFKPQLWRIVFVGIFLSLLQSLITDFSLVKIAVLYHLYHKNTVYSSLLHDVFLGKAGPFFDQLKRRTKQAVTGYVFWRGGKFYGTYLAACKNKSDSIAITIRAGSVTVKVNGQKTVIKEKTISQEQLLNEIADVIHTNLPKRTN